MTTVEALAARLADLEATVADQQARIDELETQLAEEREARQEAQAQVDTLQATVQEQAALLEALRNRTTVTRKQTAELQSRELEKGAHLRYDHVEPAIEHLDLPDDRLERFSDDAGEWVRLPDHEDPLDRTDPPLATADLLPIQQLARMDDDLLASATSRRADYLAAKAWAERGKHDRSTLWSTGCRSVREYVDASDVRVWLKSTHERPDEDLSYEHAKKLAGQTLERIRELAKHRVYIEKRSHRKDGLQYKERRLVVPADAEIPGEGTRQESPAVPETSDLPG